MKVTKPRMARSLSATLDMLGHQLRESLDDPRNVPPDPRRLEDWLNEYRSWYRIEADRRVKIGEPV